MPLITSLLRRYGNAGAVANAHGEVELIRSRSAQVDLLTDRLAHSLAVRPAPAVAA